VEPAADPPPRVRKDMLPDGTDYADTGCELAKSCLRCPLARCKYDLAGGGRRLEVSERAREMAILRTKYNAPISLLMLAYGVSRRTVFRALLEHGGGWDPKRERLRRKQEAREAARQLELELGGAPRASMTARRRRKKKT
jgi:hypothetical protein